MTQPSDASAPAPAGRSRALLAGGLAAVLLAGGAYLYLGSGSDDVDEAFVVPHTTRAVAATPTPVPVVTALPGPAEHRQGRNPFTALRVAPVGATGGEGSVGTGSTGSSGASGGSVAGSPAAVPPAGAATAVPAASPPATPTPTGSTGTYALMLVSVGEPSPDVRRAVWQVDGVTTETIPGQRFGKHGELTVLATSVDENALLLGLVLQVGDAAPQSIAIGETIEVL